MFKLSAQKPMVRLTDQDICMHHNATLSETMTWRELDKVLAIIDQQHAAWFLIGEERLCMVPFSVEGEPQLRKALMKLPRFQYDRMIKTVAEGEQGTFELWNRKLVQ